MVSRDVLVRIKGDARDLDQAARQGERSLDDLGDAADTAGRELAAAFDVEAGDFKAEISAVAGGLDDVTAGAGRAIGGGGGAGGGTGFSGLSLAALGWGAAGLVAVNAAKDWIGESITMTAELARLSDQTGLSVEFLSLLSNGANLAGVDVDELAEALKTMTEIQVESGEGAQGQIDKLKLLGLTVEDVAGLGPEALFKAFADAVAAIEDPTARVAAAQIALGGDAGALLAILEGGDITFDQFIRRARELGVVTAADAEAARELEREMAALQIRFDKIVLETLPTITSAFRGLLSVAEETNDTIRSGIDAFRDPLNNSVEGRFIQDQFERGQEIGENIQDFFGGLGDRSGGGRPSPGSGRGPGSQNVVVDVQVTSDSELITTEVTRVDQTTAPDPYRPHNQPGFF